MRHSRSDTEPFFPGRMSCNLSKDIQSGFGSVQKIPLDGSQFTWDFAAHLIQDTKLILKGNIKNTFVSN